MRRRILKTLIVIGSVALIAVLAACGPGNPSADDITIGEIGSHNGTSDYPDATTASGDFKTASGTLGEGVDEAESRDVRVADLRGRFLDGLANNADSVQSKDVTVTGSTSPDGLSGNYRVVITDETINGDDIYSGYSGGGTMTIDSYTNDVSYSIAGDGSSMTGNLWAQGTVLYDGFYNGYDDIVIDDGKVNLGVNGTATLAVNTSTGDYTLSYNIYFALKMGLALHRTGGPGGRLILNMEMTESLAPTTISSGSSTLLSSTTFPVETDFTATLILYDNSGNEIDRQTYSEDDAMELLQNASLMEF